MDSANKTILMIEDESTLLDMYKLKFEAEGFNFLGSHTGEKGIKIAREKKPDLILIDLMLDNQAEGGEIDGFTVLDKLKADKLTKKTSIYALTNLNQESDIERVKKLGADGYFVKSDITPKKLVEDIKKSFQGGKVGEFPI